MKPKPSLNVCGWAYNCSRRLFMRQPSSPSLQVEAAEVEPGETTNETLADLLNRARLPSPRPGAAEVRGNSFDEADGHRLHAGVER